MRVLLTDALTGDDKRNEHPTKFRVPRPADHHRSARSETSRGSWSGYQCSLPCPCFGSCSPCVSLLCERLSRSAWAGAPWCWLCGCGAALRCSFCACGAGCGAFCVCGAGWDAFCGCGVGLCSPGACGAAWCSYRPGYSRSDRADSGFTPAGSRPNAVGTGCAACGGAAAVPGPACRDSGSREYASPGRAGAMPAFTGCACIGGGCGSGGGRLPGA